jgi:hypothetical protein
MESFIKQLNSIFLIENIAEQEFENVLTKLQSKKEFTYHDLGKLIIWEELENLINNNKFEYYHYPNKIDGSRDINGNWIDSNIIFTNEEIKYEDEKNMMFFVFYNSEIPKEVKSLTEDQLIHQDWNYSKFLRRALNIN